MRVLILGSTGLLGRVLCTNARRRGFEVIGAARSGADYDVDIRKEDSLNALLEKTAPDLVINAAANVNIAACETDPAAAHLINARPSILLAHWSQTYDKPLVHISTDQLFDGDGDAKHDEDAGVTLCNEYARSKYAAEGFALSAPLALVVRTSLAGFHPDGRGFAHWAMDVLSNHKPLTLFDDFYGSTIDAPAFAEALFDLVALKTCGLLNVASGEISSKKQFIHALANAADITLDWAQTGSVETLKPRRARSLGLDVRKAETLLGRALPGREEVCTALIAQWRQNS